jgi:hypothetical protein
VQVQANLTIPFGTWYGWYKELVPISTTGSNVELGSRLLGRDILGEGYETLAETFLDQNMTVTWV